MCSFEEFPGVIFASSSDQTGFIPGLVCRRVDGPLPGSSVTSSLTFWKLVRLLESFPPVP